MRLKKLILVVMLMLFLTGCSAPKVEKISEDRLVYLVIQKYQDNGGNHILGIRDPLNGNTLTVIVHEDEYNNAKLGDKLTFMFK